MRRDTARSTCSGAGGGTTRGAATGTTSLARRFAALLCVCASSTNLAVARAVGDTTVRTGNGGVGRWTSAAAMPRAATLVGLASLGDGRVLAVGGFVANASDPQGSIVGLGTTHIYDPGANAWAPSTNLSRRLAGCAPSVTSLGKGRVLATGGDCAVNDDGISVSWADVFDAASATWTQTTNMTTARLGHALVTMTDGKVLAVGGEDGASSDLLSSAEVYDPVTKARLLPTDRRRPRLCSAAVRCSQC